MGERASDATRDKGLTAVQAASLEYWRGDCWGFLTAKDPDSGKPMIWTRDQRDKVRPLKPFPGHLDYLRVIVWVLLHERRVWIAKARQMYLSTIVLLVAMWECLFQPHSRVWLSKSTEDEAMDMLEEKIRFVLRQTPPWFQAWARVGPRPKRQVEFEQSESVLLAVGQNVADAEARGGTSTRSILDEACFQEHAAKIVTASLPQASFFTALSSANSGNPGAEMFQQYLEREGGDHPELGPTYETVPGLDIRRTSRGHIVLEVWPWADPSKDGAWLARVEKDYLKPGDFRREMLMDWDAAEGDAFYPEFRRDAQVRALRGVPRELWVDRGWDFGWRAPAIIWSIYSPTEDRLWIVRELCPRGVGTLELGVLGLYLSGSVARDRVLELPRAAELLAGIEASESYPPVPWFPPGTRFRDFASYEATKVSATPAGEGVERTDAAVLASLGISLSLTQQPIEAGENILRRLMNNRPDGHPGLLIDPACPTVIGLLNGGLVFSRTNPRQPRKDGRYENPHDAIRYTVSQVVPTGDPLSPETRRELAVQTLDTLETREWAQRHGRASRGLDRRS